MQNFEVFKRQFDVDIRNVDAEKVASLDDIVIPEDTDAREWLEAWAGQTRNPFVVKVKDVLVQLSGSMEL